MLRHYCQIQYSRTASSFSFNLIENDSDVESVVGAKQAVVESVGGAKQAVVESVGGAKQAVM